MSKNAKQMLWVVFHPATSDAQVFGTTREALNYRNDRPNPEEWKMVGLNDYN